MKEIIESVNEEIRPKDGFACSTCPFSHWIAGKINYSSGSDKAFFMDSKKDFLSCHCTKRHQLTYDSQNQDSSGGKAIFYTHILKCQERILASNQF